VRMAAVLDNATTRVYRSLSLYLDHTCMCLGLDRAACCGETELLHAEVRGVAQALQTRQTYRLLQTQQTCPPVCTGLTPSHRPPVPIALPPIPLRPTPTLVPSKEGTRNLGALVPG
jgi:hypothetical protein